MPIWETLVQEGDFLYYTHAATKVAAPTEGKVACLDRNDLEWAERLNEEPWGWLEYWCTSKLGHIGVPCVFCGGNTYYRTIGLIPPEEDEAGR